MNPKVNTIVSTLLALILLSAALPSYSQSKYVVAGTVTDTSKEPLPGAAVMVKGTANGALTDENGKFSISVSGTSVLEFAMLGFASKEVPVNGKKVLNVILKEDNVMLEEAIVEVGYGGQRLVDVTGTVSRVNMDDIAKAPVMSVDQALQGRIAGVQISSADGQPGAEMDIVVRGANSLTQSNSPLYVVDGFPLESFSMSGVSQNDIASITVLKDASSTAIYGSRGANGVIIIETKKGKLGKPSVQYSGTFGVQQVTRKMEMMTPYEFVCYQIERAPSNFDKYLTNVGRTLDYYMDNPGTDWQDKIFRNAFVHMHNLSLMGGTKQTRYAASASVVDQDGVISNSGFQKYQGRVSLEQKISRKLSMSVNMSYTESKVSGQSSSASLSTLGSFASYLMYRTWAYRPVSLKDLDEEDLFDEENNSATMNPYISNENEDKTRKTMNLLANVKLDWTILDGLKLTLRGGYGKTLTRNEEFNNSKTYKGYKNVNNALGVNAAFSEYLRTEWMNENTISYDRKINRNHKISVVAGLTFQGDYRSLYGFKTAMIPNEDMGMSGMDDGLAQSTSASMQYSTLMSALGRINYQLRGKYLFTLSFRADGSSKFAKGNRWGFFPSGAFAWRLGQEKFIKKVKWIDDAKLRLSYGVTGNNRVGPYDSFASLVLSDYYPIGGTPSDALMQSKLGNPDLTWESTSQFNIGYDMKLFGSRVSLNLDLYRKITGNLLLNADIPYSTGFSKVFKNIGKVRNDGLEITLSTVNIRTRNFLWTSDFNISFNRDKVLELAEGQETLMSRVSFTGEFNSTDLYIAAVGKPVASFYGVVWDGVYGYDDFEVNESGKYILKDGVPSNGDPRESIQPGDIKYVDQNNDGIVNEQDMVVIGRCSPVHTGGFNNNWTFKGFNLNVFFQWSCGNDVMNANRIIFEGNYANKNINQFRSYTDHWTIDNQDSRNFRPGGQGPRGVYSSRTIEDGSFLRLKTVQLSYTLPKAVVRKARIENVSFFISGQNLWTWTKYSGLDPEVSTRNTALTPGFDYSAYARNRIYTAGINITF